MGRVGKGVKCSVVGCDKDAIRSLPRDKVSAAGLKVSESRRSYLCRDHYKEYKKGSKKDKMLEQWRFKG
ncbi:MAG TPA: hypothetical protein ENN36_04535 [Candidatus Bathyarchaeota archaeon]|nr:hypothetical protein [Candidatus Bathyarchaeota archaeon]